MSDDQRGAGWVLRSVPEPKPKPVAADAPPVKPPVPWPAPPPPANIEELGKLRAPEISSGLKKSVPVLYQTHGRQTIRVSKGGLLVLAGLLYILALALRVAW